MFGKKPAEGKSPVQERREPAVGLQARVVIVQKGGRGKGLKVSFSVSRLPKGLKKYMYRGGLS